MDFRRIYDGVNHRHEANVLIVLKTNYIKRFIAAALIVNGYAAWRKKAIGLELFATQAHHHNLAAEVWIKTDIS